MGLYITMATLVSCMIDDEIRTQTQNNNGYNLSQTPDAVLREIVALRRRYAEAARITNETNKGTLNKECAGGGIDT